MSDASDTFDWEAHYEAAIARAGSPLTYLEACAVAYRWASDEYGTLPWDSEDDYKLRLTLMEVAIAPHGDVARQCGDLALAEEAESMLAAPDQIVPYLVPSLDISAEAAHSAMQGMVAHFRRYPITVPDNNDIQPDPNPAADQDKPQWRVVVGDEAYGLTEAVHEEWASSAETAYAELIEFGRKNGLAVTRTYTESNGARQGFDLHADNRLVFRAFLEDSDSDEHRAPAPPLERDLSAPF